MDIRHLFERHYTALVRFLYGRLGDRDRAEDLAQEAFVRLIDSRPRKPGAWLYVVGANLARDDARRDTRRSRRLALLAREGAGELPSDADPLVDAERAAAVRVALALLSERDRTILLLRAEGHSYREVADVVGVAATSVAPLLGRAQRRFARAFGASTVVDAGCARASD